MPQLLGYLWVVGQFFLKALAFGEGWEGFGCTKKAGVLPPAFTSMERLAFKFKAFAG
jgi:hypothetical protein